jgi:hypothetical protein
MKKILILCFSFFICICLFADLPGNRPRPDSEVQINGVDRLPKDWVLYKQSMNEYEYGDSSKGIPIRKDTTLIIFGGNGKPHYLRLWAQNIKTGKRTEDIVYFDDQTLNIVTIRNDSLIVQLDNKPSISNSTYTKEDQEKSDDDTGRSTSFTEKAEKGRPESSKAILIGVAAVSLSLLGWMYFSTRREKKKLK